MPPGAIAIPYHAFPEVVLGPLRLHTFGLLVAAGIAAGLFLAGRLVEESGGNRPEFDRLAVRAILAGLVGARLTWVVTHLDQIGSPLDVVAVWRGGLQFSGGFLAAVVFAWPTLAQMTHADRWRVADASAIGLAVGLALGRLGCFAVGEHLGGPTSFPLAIRYLGGTTIEGPLTVGVAYHSTSLYEFAHLAVLASLLWWLHRRGTLRLGEGIAAAAFLGWYAVARFLTDILRVHDARWLHLTGAQWVAVLVLLPATLLVVRNSRRRSTAPDVTAHAAQDGRA